MPETNAAGIPSNMYAKMLADYQQSAQGNYGQQLALGNRNKQEYEAEILKQQNEMKNKNKFWNRLKGGFESGIVNFAGQLPSMAAKAGLAALGPAGAVMGMGMGGGGPNLGNPQLTPPSMPGSDVGLSNPYATMLADPMYQNVGGLGLSSPLLGR